jgi:hypothetical protein
MLPEYYVELPEVTVVEIQHVIEVAKETAINKTKGIEISTNIGKLKMDAKKKIKEQQDLITTKLVNLQIEDVATVSSTEVETVTDEDTDIKVDVIFEEMETATTQILDDLTVNIQVEADKAKDLMKPEVKL